MSMNPPVRRGPDGPQVPLRSVTQQEVVGIGDDGRPTNGYRVSFVTASGQRGSVFLPMDRYTVANVRAAIAQHAGELEGVAGLAQG